MLGFKGFFAGQASGPDFTEIAAWAERNGHQFKRERDGRGCVIDGEFSGTPWRLEWGPSQRAYIMGHELRLRMDLRLPPDLQMLMLSRSLLDTLEKEAFDQITENNQTELGGATPEETRWLTMFPKIQLGSSRLMRAAFGGVSSLPEEGPAWLEGPLEHALLRAAGTLLRAQPPFALITLRGKLYLRMQLGSADETDIAAALALFEIAGNEARRVGKARADEPVSWSSTLSTAWQNSVPGRDAGK